MPLPFRTELPPIYAAIFIPAFLLLFAGMWWLIPTMLGYLSGWNRIASLHAATGPTEGRKFGAVSGLMGKTFPSRTHFGSALTVVVAQTGFRLSLSGIMRRASTPDLFIPWTAIEGVEEEKQFLSSCCHVTLDDFATGIWVYGKAGEAILEAWQLARR